MAQYGLHGLERGLLADARLEFLNGIFHQRHSVLDDRLHEARFHHTAVVGYGIIECKGIDRCYLSAVSDAHPRQHGLVLHTTARIALRVAYDGAVVAHERKLQVFVHTDTIESVDVFLGVFAIIMVYDPTHTDIGTHLQGACHIDVAISALSSPVMVAHETGVHLHDTATGVDNLARVAHSVVESHHDGCGLEHRSRFATIVDGGVDHLAVFAVLTLRHVDYGLDVAGLHLHEYCHAHLAVYRRFLEFFHQSALSQVLHVHIDGGHEVGTVDGRCIHNRQELIENSAAVHDAVLAAEQGVIGELQSAASRILRTKHVADGASCYRTVRTLSCIIILCIETTLVTTLVKQRERFHHGIGGIVDSPGPQ